MRYQMPAVSRQMPAGQSGRLAFLVFLAIFLGTAIVLRLVQLQIFQADIYKALAEGQHEVYAKLFPERGEIFVRERGSGKLFPIAVNRYLTLVFAEPKNISNPKGYAAKLAPMLNLDEKELLAKLSKADDPYEPLARGLDDETAKKIKDLKLQGVGFARESARFYPEKNFSGQLTGFVGFDGSEKSGRYGLEGYFEEDLKGEAGFLESEKDAAGRLIPTGRRKIREARNGSRLVLTIDRGIQYFVCDKVKEAAKRHGADSGSAIVMDPNTGAIMAMCSYPDFDPNEYSKVKDISVFLNPIVSWQYEPGSVFKPITMAAAIDMGKVLPSTVYEDAGQVAVGAEVIKNSDGKAYGKATMVNVLENSLNTGAVFVVRQIGGETFLRYVKDFGFGSLTGIELTGENIGNIQSLKKSGEIWPATASFGQGISVTPLQLLTAYAVLANGGKIVKPFIVDEIQKSDGVVLKTRPKIVRQVISSRTSILLRSMLASVVQNGHGKRAGVAGYYIAGKTGTAQVPKKEELGYESDKTIGSFAGFAPADNPAFVMVVKIDNPRDVQWAESSAAPLFGEIAKFILNYLEIPPEKN